MMVGYYVDGVHETSGSVASTSEYINNTKKVAVYLEDTNTSAHDSYCTSLFFEYNITYLFNNTISVTNMSKYDLVVFPDRKMSNSTASIVNNYLNTSHARVWFLVDPRFNENDERMEMTRISLLGGYSQYSINPGQTIYIDNTDPLVSWMPSTYVVKNTVQDWMLMRSYTSNASTINNYYYTTLMSRGNRDGKMMIKYWNNENSKVIYSNYNAFISGGQVCEFDPQTANHLFNSLKSWMLDLDPNTYGAMVTYPKSDKIVSNTIDDLYPKYADITSTSNYFAMKASFPYTIPDTYFIIPRISSDPSTITNKTALDYFASMGDTHTMHPHCGLNWTDPSLSVQDTMTNLTQMQGIVNNVEGTSNYGFNSFRFPGTIGTIAALKAVDNLGYKISTNYGPYSGISYIGSIVHNDLFLPKHKILYNAKSNLTELEIGTNLDVDEPNASQFYDDNTKAAGYFLKINFPSNYIIVGHIQAMMTDPDTIDNTSKLFTWFDQNTSYASYENLTTIGQYLNGVENADIKVISISNGISAQVTTSTFIPNFTIKLTKITNGISAQYDGMNIGINNVVYEDGNYFVFHDVTPGTHYLNITDTDSSLSSLYIGKNGLISKKIADSGIFVKNNAGSNKTATLSMTNVFINAINTITSTQNTLTVPKHVTSSIVNASFITNGTINVSISNWNTTGDYRKTWNESSNINNIQTSHVIGDFPANTMVMVYKNGTNYTSVTSNSTGYINFTYAGGYSNLQFDTNLSYV